MKLKTKFCKIALPAALVGTLLLSGCQPNSGGTELKEIAPALKKMQEFKNYSSVNDGKISVRTAEDKYDIKYTGNTIADIRDEKNPKADSEINIKLSGETFDKDKEESKKSELENKKETNKDKKEESPEEVIDKDMAVGLEGTYDDKEAKEFANELKSSFLAGTDFKLETKVRGDKIELKLGDIRDVVNKKIDETSAKLGDKDNPNSAGPKMISDLVFSTLLGQDAKVAVIDYSKLQDLVPQDENSPVKVQRKLYEGNKEVQDLTMDFIENKIGDYKSPSLKVTKDGYEFNLDKANLAKEILSIKKYATDNRERLEKDLTEYINAVNKAQGNETQVKKEDISKMFDDIQKEVDNKTKENKKENPVEMLGKAKEILDTFKEFNLKVSVSVNDKEINQDYVFKLFLKNPENKDKDSANLVSNELDIDAEGKTVMTKETKDIKFKEFKDVKYDLLDGLKEMQNGMLGNGIESGNILDEGAEI